VQTFIPHQRINRIYIFFSSLGRNSRGYVIFRVKSELNGTGIHNETQELESIDTGAIYTIRIDPLNDSLVGKMLYLVIDAPESVPDDAPTIYASGNDTYPEGELYVNGTSTGRDITFITRWVP